MRSASSSPRRMQSSSAAHSTSSSRVCGKSRALGTPPTAWPERPARCRKVAIERGEPSWQTRSTSPMSRPSSSEAVATSTFSSPRLSRCSASSRVSLARLPWCAATASLPSRSPRCARCALGHAPGVDEDQRRPVQQHQLRDPAVDLLPLVVRHHRRQRRERQLERQVAPLGIADVDDRAVGDAVARGGGADQEAGDLGDRLLRRRQADAAEALRLSGLPRMRFDEGAKALEREREVAAALARGHRMDLVDDDRANRRQHRPAALASRAARRATPGW